MKIKQWILVTCMGMMSVQGNAQAVSDLEYEGRQNYGLKLGMGLNSMYGGKLINPRPTVGFMAGFYLHTNPESLRHWGFKPGWISGCGAAILPMGNRAIPTSIEVIPKSPS